MKNVNIRPATISDAVKISEELRGISKDDIERIGLDVTRTIESAMQRASYVWIGTINGKIACMWGVEQPTLLSNRAYLWLITTPIVELSYFVFLRQSQMQLKKLLETYETIYGFVDARFTRSIKWLTWLGFTISPSDQPIHRFSKSRA